jgi:hypothetical protein
VDPVCALGSSVVISSREAQAEIKNAIAKNKAPKIASRFITRVKTNHDSLSLKSLRLRVVRISATKLSSFAVASVDW